MYYLETTTNDNFGKWAAKVFYVNEKGTTPKRTMQRFSSEKEANRVAHIINNMCGHGIYTIVEVKQKKQEQTKAEIKEVKLAKPIKVERVDIEEDGELVDSELVDEITEEEEFDFDKDLDYYKDVE